MRRGGEEKKIRIGTFQDLDAWQEAHRLVLDVYNELRSIYRLRRYSELRSIYRLRRYKVTRSFPANEQFGLTSQIKRAVVSITSNIAEGFSRYSYLDRNKYYFISRGSLSEVESLLLTARDLQYLNKSHSKNLFEQSEKVAAIFNGLIKATSSRATRPYPIGVSEYQRIGASE